MYVSQISTFVKTSQHRSQINIQTTCLEFTSPQVNITANFRDTFSDFKTEHGGLREDGSPDQRVGTGGMKLFFPHGGIKWLTDPIPEFAQGKADPVKAGRIGGLTADLKNSGNNNSGVGSYLSLMPDV
jgi:hypothetical protein